MFLRSKLFWSIGAGVIVVAVAVTVWLVQRPKPAATGAFPATVKAEIGGFKFYYPKQSDVSFKYVSGSANYQNGVLVFELTDAAGKSLAFTEEATPPNFDTSSLKADKQYSNENGQVYISDLLDRTSGALFTSDGTWVLINAPSPIGASGMQRMLDSLTRQ